jgi:hydroxymethylpyrimidine pyrophosphatase-like HAD family hydrolase
MPDGDLRKPLWLRAVSGPPNAVVYLDLDGTLLGPDGNLFADQSGDFCDAAVRALRRLTDAGIPYVLVSGRSALRVAEAARLLGAAGGLAEIGALDAGYPTEGGQTVHDAIAATGIPAELLAREPLLEPHPVSRLGREGSHVLRGVAGPDADEWVRQRSAGTLRLADNGRVGPGETRVYHLLPVAASKALSVRKDVERRGVDPRECLSVGDSREDMEISTVVGTTALVANGMRAEPALAELATFVTRAGHGAGVLEAVQRWGRAGGGRP